MKVMNGYGFAVGLAGIVTSTDGVGLGGIIGAADGVVPQAIILASNTNAKAMMM